MSKTLFTTLSSLLLASTSLFARASLFDKEITLDQPPTNANPALQKNLPPGAVPNDQLPWLTGPLLCPSGHVVPVGHLNVEPYLNANVTRGGYDKNWAPHSLPHNFYNINTFCPFQFGIARNWDISFTPSFSWNHTDGASHWVVNDMTVQFDYQIFNDIPGTWPPAVKLTFGGTLPLGKYQKLDPNDKGTDGGGQGAWDPTIGITFSRLFHYCGVHFLSARWNFNYGVPGPVHVKGLNVYGGGRHTHGTVYPGNVFVTDIGLEYTLARKWALALDIRYQHANKTRFSGHKGKTNGVTNTVGGPSSEQFSLAPAFEYNWNPYVGLIAGVWFSVAGRNTPEFVNGIIAINVYK